MQRVAPSQIARQQLQELLAGGADRESNIISALVETVTRVVVQELLEGEQADYLGGRGRYERRGEGQVGSRNGYAPARVRTAEGAFEVAVPQVRGAGQPFRSSLMSFLDGNSAVLERLVAEMYARGLSTRDVEDAFRDATGEPLISKSAVSEITDRLWEDYQAFISRDLSEIAVEYLFVDAIFESLRRHGAKEALLVAWCIASDGRKHLVHLAVGNKEAQACWTEFFRGMLGRGLRAPTTVTSDGAPGLIKAITTCFPTSIRIRCWFHRLGNIRAKLPDETAGQVLAHLYAVRDAPTLDASRAAADRFVNTYGREYPAAVACFTDDLDALLAIHRVPVRHRIRVRTTNLAERSFVEERRRTKVIPRFTDEKAAMKLVFATLIRAADRWCRVSISDLERHQLRLLRTELGIDPPPANTDDRKTNRTNDIAA
ncbi:MAG TPA: IS256 family transposase [Pseudonocardiaceae bacterium]|nr:IS256 family transposase [Pseudonocardiaceae bacterium]